MQMKEKKYIIPVFFTFDRNYVLAAAVAIYSLLKNASKQYQYALYVLHTDIPISKQQRLIRLLDRFSNATLEFIDVSVFDDDKSIQQKKAHFSKEIYYKLIVAEVFPQYSRIICSDVDVVFLRDISSSYFLFEDEFFYFAGVGQILEGNRMNDYGNRFSQEELSILEKEIGAGYMLINLDAIRKMGIQSQLTTFYKKNYSRLYLPEQDCLTLCCWPHIKYLPMEYGICVEHYRVDPDSASFYKGSEVYFSDQKQGAKLFKQALETPILLHYAGALKPWNSYFREKWNIWLSMMYEAGFLKEYILSRSHFLRQRLQRYSLRRFLKKLYVRLSQR